MDMSYRRGFTLLFATLIAALLLAVGLAVFDIIFKEVSFATIVRDSNTAIYAADTGIECAEYWDFQCQNAQNSGVCSAAQGPTAFAQPNNNSSPPTKGVLCAGQDIALYGSPGGMGGPWLITYETSPVTDTTEFQINLGTAANSPCVIVDMGKSFNASGATTTTIISQGYNTCNASDPNRIERAFYITY